MKLKDIQSSRARHNPISNLTFFPPSPSTIFRTFMFYRFRFLVHSSANALRVKRQDDKSDKKNEESFEQELCKDKEAGEWFRLVANDGDSCRDVIQCTTSVS